METLARRSAPFFGLGVIGVLLGSAGIAGFDSRARTVAILLAPLAALALLVRWERLSDLMQALPLFGGLLLLLPLTVHGGPISLAYFAPALLPVLWLATQHGRRELLVGLSLLAIVFMGPPLAARDPSAAALSGLYTALLFLVGTRLQDLAWQTRDQASHSAVVSRVVRQVMAGSQPDTARLAICEGLMELAGARSAVLYELDSEGRLVHTANAGEPVPHVSYSVEGSGQDGQSPPLLAFRSGRMVRVGHRSDSRQDSGIWGGEAPGVCHPIFKQGRAVGVLGVLWEARARTPRGGEDVARIFAQEAGALLQQSDLLSRLDTMARTDSLTSIPNRRAWDERLEEVLNVSAQRGGYVTVAIIDLDHFKAYNDDWGHQRGDRLLQEVAQAWGRALREADFLARYGGDEFGLILPRCGSDEAQEVILRLRAATPEGQTFSVGLAAWDWAESPGELLARADAALYETKRTGRGRTGVAPARRREGQLPNWAQLIPELLRDRSIFSVYQPILDLTTRKLLGYEALARPRAQGAEVSVEALFSAAQHLGHLRDLDWLCRIAAVRGATGLPVGYELFVNVGVRALLDPVHPVDQMLLLLESAGRSASDVVLEVSEREAVRDMERLAEVLAEYRRHGFRFALDDVGEGHSTLEVLAVARPEYIKVARSLTVGADFLGPGSVIAALVAFAQLNGSQLIAEGIEDQHQLQLMRELGVTLGQGWALGRPAALPSNLDARGAGF